MGSLVLTGDTSGAGTITVPAVAGTFTATIGSATGTHYPFTAGTAVASTSGTSIDFTSIPSWVKRITVMFDGVSTSGTSLVQVQLGDAGGIEATSYVSYANYAGGSNSTNGVSSTTGLLVDNGGTSSQTRYGVMVINAFGSNKWVSSGSGGMSQGATIYGVCSGRSNIIFNGKAGLRHQQQGA